MCTLAGHPIVKFPIGLPVEEPRRSAKNSGAFCLCFTARMNHISMWLIRVITAISVFYTVSTLKPRQELAAPQFSNALGKILWK